MIDSKAIVLLKSFSKEELRWCAKFVRSPYHNSNKLLVALFDYLRSQYPLFPEAKLSPKLLFKKLFPGEAINLQRLHVLFHRLAKLLSSFLVAENIKKDEVLEKEILINSFTRKGSYELFVQNMEGLLEKLRNSKVKDQDELRLLLDLLMKYYGHPTTNRMANSADYLKEAVGHLEEYYTLVHLKLSCALKTRERNLPEFYDTFNLETKAEVFLDSNRVIFMYAKLLKLEANKSDQLFKEIFQTFISEIEEFGLVDRRALFTMILNYCVFETNRGSDEYSKISLQLYKAGLVSDCVLAEGKIKAITFVNIVSIGLNSGELEWVATFIDEYSNSLDAVIREDSLCYSKALLKYFNKDYEGVVDEVLHYNFTQVQHDLLARTLLIRSYFELFLRDNSYYDLLINQTRKYERYLNHHEGISQGNIYAFCEFSSMTRKLVNIKYQNRRVEEFRKQLLEKGGMVLKKWLLSKID